MFAMHPMKMLLYHSYVLSN